jgi:hypothetical protein
MWNRPRLDSSRAPLTPSSHKPTDEANGCKLRHAAPKTLQKAQYVGFLRKSLAPTGSVLWLAPISSPRKRASHARWTNLRSEPSERRLAGRCFRGRQWPGPA